MTDNSKIAISLATDKDRDRIYHLRHDVFGSELRQHSENESGILRDKLDDFNTYIIAKIDDDIVGFISITAPDKNLYSIDKYFDREELPFVANEGLYEMRILTVVKAHRGKPIALALMWGAFRWIQSNGGDSIMAIGKTDLLDMYVKLGFKAMNKTVQSGEVCFELLYGNVEVLNTFIETNYKQLFLKLEKQCDWNIGISFFKPANCYHGGSSFEAIGNEFDALHRKENIINADVLDAWFDPSPKVISALEAELKWISKTSPPTDSAGMAKCIAKYRGVKNENILPGAGSSDLIFMAFKEWLTRSSRVLILDPSYGEYAHILDKVIRCQVDRLELLKENKYAVDIEALISKAKECYDLIVLINPNSPTGQYLSKRQLETVLKQIPSTTRVWIDETYIEYVGKNNSLETYAAQSTNVIVCKSMSKVYGLSGLRAAYLCASPYQLETLQSVSPPWAVSLPAQYAAILALKDEEYYEKCYAETHILRDEFINELSKNYFVEVTPSVANYVLCHLPLDGPNAEFIIEKCRERGLYLRDVSNMGSHIGNHIIRIAIKDRDTNNQMLKILQEVLACVHA
ncbi:aminotransferase class I/II-fold pyridoxal phosphate-dependent enzyme [Carboxylicivirga marina]|uniref:Aminotransferase n=1 Tax=Carboxylicivirga marina TaxID=2800988 RepID=A0ABS1HNV2_9BACT|nr:aminotransferase class I/II-fold pyridoxal phosphate-dependent enzyme [Carboxylicivirga marina]MBK3519368.1 aminotransferase class I/II-fold pyridoxal phosphate-dependent enzyme [Carboxylicivirga marina]